MSQEILSIKLHELDQKLSTLYSRILMTESADHDQIRREKERLKTICAQNEADIRERLRDSKATMIGEFSDAYDELECIIGDTMQKMGICKDETGLSLSSFVSDDFLQQDTAELIEMTERKILFAEYALDFAMLTADHALLFTLDAMDADMTAEESASS